LARFLAPIVLVIALLGAGPAAAGVAPKVYAGQAELGSDTATTSASGSCSTSGGLVSDLTLRCGSLSGSVRARYLFTVPKKAGSVTTQVNFFGSRGGARVTTKRVSDTQFRVDVTLDSTGRADIASVMIEYYYCRN
jgi:hypothetical protein